MEKRKIDLIIKWVWIMIILIILLVVFLFFYYYKSTFIHYALTEKNYDYFYDKVDKNIAKNFISQKAEFSISFPNDDLQKKYNLYWGDVHIFNPKLNVFFIIGEKNKNIFNSYDIKEGNRFIYAQEDKLKPDDWEKENRHLENKKEINFNNTIIKASEYFGDSTLSRKFVSFETKDNVYIILVAVSNSQFTLDEVIEIAKLFL